MTGSAAAESAKINGSDIYYETLGDGPPILMMHGGLGFSHDYLQPYFDRLAESHTVIYYDHLGNGRSARPDDYAELTFDRMVSDAAGLMAHLGHEKFTLIGHSYGGFVAQAFAAQKADLLDGLILLDTVPALDYKPNMAGNEQQMAAFGRMFSGPMTNNDEWRKTWTTAVQMYFHRWDDAVGAALDEATVYEYRAWNVSGALLKDFNLLSALPGIQTPTLVISGRHDGITPPGPGTERIAALLPNAELVILEDSGHYPFIEQQDAFFKALQSWLAR
ncbi:MAG: alpha/beta fold hydrolase [Rhizobiaceae bacterium]